MTVSGRQLLRPAASLEGSIRVPSDKSVAHRALICAALAHGKSEIELFEPGADVLSTIGALRQLGARIQTYEAHAVFVDVDGLGDASSIGALPGGTADCGNSGTTMRLLCGALASGAGVATLTGDSSLTHRPMQRVTDPLHEMGAHFSLNDGHAPLVVRGRRPLRAADHTLQVASAQILGAIALAALAADGVTTVRLPSRVRDHTERMLGALGADIERHEDGDGTVTVIKGPSGLRAQITAVPGDFSAAAAWLVTGAIHPHASIEAQHVLLNPSRTALIDVLREMGADIAVDQGSAAGAIGEPTGGIEVRSGRRLRAISLGAADIAPLIDELPLLAVAMAAADGTSEVRGARELRVKESDRIAAMVAALTAAGAHVEELDDGWRITRGQPLDAEIVTHGDHRIAMAMAVAGWTGVARSVVLDDPACVAVSYPSFWNDARAIGAMQ
jgi:3-phosphoshikimate 1-carboxyvinyltransferase